MEENIIIYMSLTKEKNKSLLINNINLIFHIQGKIIQEFINVPNIKKIINVNLLLF